MRAPGVRRRRVSACATLKRSQRTDSGLEAIRTYAETSESDAPPRRREFAGFSHEGELDGKVSVDA